ncbi:MAG: transketolase family protein [Lachnospiraceae bacterium]|nr:transketolase family protein [Lachnospiraceae bacterium]
MSKISNKQMICEVLMKKAETDKNLIALASDARGSASMTPFFDAFPAQSVETGIAEQDLVSIAAGLAKAGKRPFAFSPASFLSTRSYEQAKVDVAYSNVNVKLIGISGGISYGALGMSHHSAQDFASMAAIPNMRVYCPSDRFQTEKLTEALAEDDKPAYLRVGRNAVDDVYEEGNVPFVMDKATVIGEGKEVVFTACGEMVKPCVDAMKLLENKGISSCLLDMYCVKPFDRETFLEKVREASLVVTAEEHSPYGGLGSIAAMVLGAECPKPALFLSLPDAPVITGTSQEVYEAYGLTGEGIFKQVLEKLGRQ